MKWVSIWFNIFVKYIFIYYWENKNFKVFVFLYIKIYIVLIFGFDWFDGYIFGVWLIEW